MEKWNSKFDILKVTLTVDDQYKERWASPGTFNMLASSQVTKIIIQGILSKSGKEFSNLYLHLLKEALYRFEWIEGPMHISRNIHILRKKFWVLSTFLIFVCYSRFMLEEHQEISLKELIEKEHFFIRTLNYHRILLDV